MRGADQTVLEQMRLTVFEVVVGVLRSKEFVGDIPKAVETACKVNLLLSTCYALLSLAVRMPIK